MEVLNRYVSLKDLNRKLLDSLHLNVIKRLNYYSFIHNTQMEVFCENGNNGYLCSTFIDVGAII